MSVDYASDRIFLVGPPGLVFVSLCAPKDLTVEQVESWVNREHPTGISSNWRLAEEDFATGQGNPCPCDQEPESRLHYLLNC